ncbi:MAG TPA: tripartite tricarboxylate transporter substrate binding protein [Desulfobacteraceae bacterium]|nr:tripartite tricarboxylate transporter substrate binding protein [Desulfobacteraceae bacterium]
MVRRQKMKKTLISFIVVVAFLAGYMGVACAEFPVKPIKVVVYTKPGGAGDVFARKFTAIAKQYTDASFVVVNKPGAGGVKAIKYILKSKADGYQLAFVTRSNIGKIVSTGGTIDINDLAWMAMMVSDPEAIITLKSASVNTWEQVVADAKAKNGKQIWVGPAAGGNDHIMAMKTWKIAGIGAKWVPYKGGSKAMAALMGGHGIAYVGNPQDVIGRPDLKVAVISNPTRIGGDFADVPTFKELGYKGLDNEIMWRGFMVKKGVPQEAYDFYMGLFEKVNKDAKWQAYIKRGGATPVLYKEDKFFEIVKKDKAVFTETLKDLGAIK